MPFFCCSAAPLAVAPGAATDGAELPPEIQVDRLLVQAEREIKDGEHWSAMFTFERILAVCEEHGLNIPAEFWFRQAGVLHSAGLHERAIKASTRYLQEAGQDGTHYQAALELLDAPEVGLADARREEARAKAAAERAAREAEARRAAIAPSVPQMVVIPAGTFRMGCVSGRQCDFDEKPIREVRIESFEISKHEVTFAEWDACLAAGGCGGHEPDDWGWGRGARPVINVSWDDAQAYVSWLSAQTGAAYRLPSEAEWEYAARAGTVTKYHWGDGVGANRANCDGCGSRWDGERTAPVGSFAPNAFGLHDMHGNVLERTQDCWNGSYRDAPSDGSAWIRVDCGERVRRGGSWINSPRHLRSANRSWNITSSRDIGSGFRVARTLTP